MNKNYYYITFLNGGFYHCNIAAAENVNAVVDHYNRYEIVSVRPAEAWEISAAEKKHMPIVEL